MKLKKIASLMLAGIMAVSMLAGCNGKNTTNENPGQTEEPTTSNVTQAVLGKTSAALQKKLSVNSDTKLDEAVAFAAANNNGTTYVTTLTELAANNPFVVDASTIMKGGDIKPYTADPDTWDFDRVEEDAIYWTMFAVNRTKSDEWIENELADWLDEELVNQFADNVQHSNFEYSIRVTMTDCTGYNILGDGKDSASSVIIGVAITCDDLTDNH